MNVDGALNIAGMSLEILAVGAGVLASPTGRGARQRFANWGERMKLSIELWPSMLVLTFVLMGGSFLLLSIVPSLTNVPSLIESWPHWVVVVTYLLGSLLVGALGFPLGKTIPSVTLWAIQKLPDDEEEIGVFLGLAGGVFGIGVVLQLIAVATP